MGNITAHLKRVMDGTNDHWIKPAIALFGAVLTGVFAVMSLRDGFVSSRSGSISKDESPFEYWSIVTFLVVLTASLLVLAGYLVFIAL